MVDLPSLHVHNLDSHNSLAQFFAQRSVQNLSSLVPLLVHLVVL